jgi:uncharacterized membrane protein
MFPAFSIPPNIVVDWRFALALMPYILFGPVSRV